MPSKNSTRGKILEREIVNYAKSKGFEAKRAYASNGESLGLTEDVDLLIETFRVQAKRRKKLASFLQISPNFDAVAFRQDRGQTLILITLDQYLEFIKCTMQK